jgi:hypothetical protein
MLSRQQTVLLLAPGASAVDAAARKAHVPATPTPGAAQPSAPPHWPPPRPLLLESLDDATRADALAAVGDGLITRTTRKPSASSMLDDSLAVAQVDCGIAAALKMHADAEAKRARKLAPEGVRAGAAERQARHGRRQRTAASGDSNAADPPTEPRVAHAAASQTVDEAEVVGVLQVLRAQLCIDAEIPIVAFVLIERALLNLRQPGERGTAGSGCDGEPLTAATWRALLISAVILAAKAWFDEELWLVDVRHHLRAFFDLSQLGRQEADLCRLLGFNVHVGVRTFFEYYFALRELGRKRLGKAQGAVGSSRGLPAGARPCAHPDTVPSSRSGGGGCGGGLTSRRASGSVAAGQLEGAGGSCGPGAECSVRRASCWR